MCSLEALCTLRLLKEDIGVIKRSSNLAHTKFEGGSLEGKACEVRAGWKVRLRSRYDCGGGTNPVAPGGHF